MNDSAVVPRFLEVVYVEVLWMCMALAYSSLSGFNLSIFTGNFYFL